MTQLSVLVSCPFSSPWPEQELPAGWVVRGRPVDLGVGRARATLARLREVVAIARQARRQQALVISTSALELLLLCLLRPLFRQCLLVAYDPLQAGSPRLRRLAERQAARIDLVLCIRRSDLPAWGRAHRTAFVPFLAPAPTEGPSAASRDTVTVYSAGDAHRDYRLLVEAVRGTDLDVTICTRQPVDTTGVPGVTVLPAVSPEEGRRRQASSGITAVLLQDTSLPAGPLVLLDAMALGAAIVCTSSRGLVDYVDDEVEALVLPPDPSPEDLRERLLRLRSDRALRERLARNARRRLSDELAPRTTVLEVARHITRAMAS